MTTMMRRPRTRRLARGTRLFPAVLFLVAGTLPFSGCTGIVSGSPGTPNPLTISSPASSSPTPTGITIGWQTNVAATSQVQYGATNSYGSSTVVDANMVTSHQQGVSGLKPATLYHFRVLSTDASNQTATGNDMTFTTATDSVPPAISITSPAAGANLSATVSVTATASDNVGVASVQFQLDGANVGTIETSVPFVFSWDTTKSSNGTHNLRAIAKDTSGNTGTSASVGVTVNSTPPDTTPPSVPSGLAATPVSTSQINLSWIASTDNVGVTGYKVFRGGAQIATSATTTYQDKSLAAATTFTYSVAAIDAAGNTSAQSSSVSASTSASLFQLSGSITPAASGSGAIVTLSGVAGKTATADANGNYSFTGLANGSYSVTPSKSGVTFTPSSLLVTVNGADVTATIFTATIQTFSISGTVTPAASGSGTNVALSGASTQSTTVDSTGNYSFSGLSSGLYTVTPGKSGFTFSPGVLPVTISGGNVTGVNFSISAQPPTFRISGTISPASAGAGSLVTLSGAASFTTTADASGTYSFTSLSNGSYTVTPSSTAATFSPTNQAVVISNSNVGSVNFTATATSKVIFFDDFTGTTLDTTAWVAMNRAGDYSNSEQECYNPSQVSVSNSNLVITSIGQTATCGDANHAPSQFPSMSGMVQWKTFNFTYGTVEFRAQMAGGQGTWPAVWLLGANCQPTNVSSADNSGACFWPQPGSDEIDITEILYSNHTSVNQQIHTVTNSDGCKATTADVSQNFHVYQLEWAPGSLIWRIDGTPTCQLTNSSIPSNPMFLMINTAMGGVGGAINNTTLPQSTTVDYVKITQP